VAEGADSAPGDDASSTDAEDNGKRWLRRRNGDDDSDAPGGPRHSVRNSTEPRLTVADLLADSDTPANGESDRPAPGENLAERLAAATAADAARAAELEALDAEDAKSGRLRRAVGWLFAPKDEAEDGYEPEADQAL